MNGYTPSARIDIDRAACPAMFAGIMAPCSEFTSPKPTGIFCEMMDDDDEVSGEIVEFIFGMHAPQIVKLVDNRSVIVNLGDTLWGFEDPIGRLVFCNHVPRTLH